MPDDPSIVLPEECRYQAALELREERELPKEEGIEKKRIEPGRYAVFVPSGDRMISSGDMECRLPRLVA